nr:uncharacterized protein LOC113803297 isoform X1 [Penaeus vannamei]XP_027209850.1 uncharacterized protein LOC113803297 isoform X1 [Penaeus vannamei]XP_027209851.1 uncharacterized protein LOC113803297 isoform X1 [Penaeus vannamei]XP_027209852.1 uncharacterized protein LOC113803297 isoform X1 [Penaeus vannamei]XP_027209853.1 uncharacterized protein LOC113803297 isoform X1 [Penaeus vannamei]XP_027209854.1 uncharacterized protein LOC113803297 isoform X1 [Penaeus vannamei]XP_027209855.1 uncharac
MADLRILLLVSLLSLPPGQGEGPCLDELYVEGCPSYLFQAIGLYLDTNRTVFIEPREISEIIIRSGGYQPVNITTRHQIRLWGNGSKVCVDGPGIQTKKWIFNDYLEIESSNPLWFTLDCISASHSCRFHRLVKVVFVPDENGLVTWRPEAHLFELKVGVLGRTGRIAPVQPANGQHSYNITIHGSSAGPSCGISCPSLNLNFMSAKVCGQPMFISANYVGYYTWSYFDFSALVSRHTASGPPEDVPTALASPSSISTVDGDKTSKTFPLLVCAREGMLRRPAKGIFGFECDLGCWQNPTVVA